MKFNDTNFLELKWRTIKYTEKKGLFQNDIQYGCGYIDDYELISDEYITRRLIQDKIYILLGMVSLENDSTQYNEYFRKRISELDLLANILSLMANIFTGMKMFYRFYSNNFNNYKIIEELFIKQNIKKEKIKQYSDIKNSENNKLFSLNDDLIEKCINKGNNNENTINDNYEDNNDESNSNNYLEDGDSKKIKKLSFYDFYLNNLYCCCKKQKNQNIIHICNKIVHKYASIDTLIKNQILLENLMKDYKWNDPNLNKIENNNLLIQLKTYL